MIYRNYFRFWNWLENFKSTVFARDLLPTLFLWASMGLSRSRIRTGSGTETEMDVVANQMSVLSGNVQVALCFHRKIRIFCYKIFLISVSVNNKSKVKLFKYYFVMIIRSQCLAKCLCTNLCNWRYSHCTNRTLFSQKILILSKKTLLDIRLPIFFRVQNPESIQNGNGNRHTVQAVQERMQNGHGSGQSELQRMRNGNPGPSESEVVIVNGHRSAHNSPVVASTSQGESLLYFWVKFWISDFIFRSFYCAIFTNSMFNFFLCKILV